VFRSVPPETLAFWRAVKSPTPGPALSADFTALIAGTYQWIATYSGDANNDGAVTACNDPNESVVVGSAFETTQVLPTLSGWALIALASLLMLVSFVAVRRKVGQ
jgi:hypothetical protein